MSVRGRLIRTRRQTHPALLRAGWVCLFIGFFLPFCVAVFAAYRLRDLTCAGDLAWTVAPLVFTCGERTIAELFFGWAGTIASITGLVIAVVIAIGAAFGPGAQPTAYEHPSASRHFALTVAAAAIACCAVFLSRPDESWGTGSWLFFTSTAGLLVCTAGFILRIVLKARTFH